MEQLVDLVDDADCVVGVADRSDLEVGLDRWRTVALVVVSSDGGHVLLSQRSAHHQDSPGRWGPPVAGPVTSGETYDEAIVRETFDTFGVDVDIDDMHVLYRGPFDTQGHLNNVSLYLLDAASLPRLVELNPDDFDRSSWVLLDGLAADVSRNPEMYIPQMMSLVELLT